MGEVRSWRGGRNGVRREPFKLSPFRKCTGKSRPYVVKMKNASGKYNQVTVIKLMVDNWLGGSREGMVAYHKNGQLDDNCLNNIGFTTRAKLGKATGAKAEGRRPVEKLDPLTLKPLEVYGSAREAARANFMSYQTILDRCNNPKAFRSPKAPDGYIYRYERD